MEQVEDHVSLGSFVNLALKLFRQFNMNYQNYVFENHVFMVGREGRRNHLALIICLVLISSISLMIAN